MRKSRGVALLVIGFFLGGLLYVLSQGGVSTNKQEQDVIVVDKTAYQVGDLWTLEGEWALTVTSVAATEERNSEVQSEPTQVIIVTYDYENLGNAGTGVIVANEMTLDLASAGQVVDEQGEAGYVYPLEGLKAPAGIDYGEKASGVQVAFALNHVSSSVDYSFRYYDMRNKYLEVPFHWEIQ